MIQRDPGQVEIKAITGTIYLYTHYHGKEIFADVHRALSKQRRWDDPPFLTRMIFGEMVPSMHLTEENGLGIGLVPTSNVPHQITLDCMKGFIHLYQKDPLPFWGGTFLRFITEFKTEEYQAPCL